MDCTTCELTQRHFFCPKCLQQHIRELRLRINHASTERDDQVSKCIRALDYVQRNRSVRADIAAAQDHLEELAAGLAKLRRDIDTKRERLRALRESLTTRQQTLATAKSLSSSSSTSTSARNAPAQSSMAQALLRETHDHQSLSIVLARARAGLVKELVDVFNVSQQSSPASPTPTPAHSNISQRHQRAQSQTHVVGGVGGTTKVPEWSIGDLVLPVPGDIRRYPPDHINAVITHTIHFISLLTFYLGVKLPFQISWSGGKFGVGTPWIGAIRGGEAGGWAKWYTKHPLHLSATPAPALSSPLTSSTSSAELISDSVDLLASQQIQPLPPSPTQTRVYTSPYHHSRPPRPRHSSTTSATLTTKSSKSSHHKSSSSSSSTTPFTTTTTNNNNGNNTNNNTQVSFSTALAMLIYNTTFLAHSQSLDIPLSQTGNILANLYAICASSELGRKSHETRPYLLPPGVQFEKGEKGGGAGFLMEFTQVVQVVSVHPRAKPLGSAAKRGKGLDDVAVSAVEEEWEMLDENEEFA